MWEGRALNSGVGSVMDATDHQAMQIRKGPHMSGVGVIMGGGGLESQDRQEFWRENWTKAPKG